MISFNGVAYKIDWRPFLRQNRIKIFFVGFILLLSFFAFSSWYELPVWYFRLTTFSFDQATTLKNRQAACAQLQAPVGRTSLADLSATFPADFLKDKHFFEVFYSPALKQCVYAGVDIFSASGKQQPHVFEYNVPLQDSSVLTSTVSFYVASPYVKDCTISGGWCAGIGRGRGAPSSLKPDFSIKYSRTFFNLLTRTPLPVQASVSANDMFTFAYFSTSGEPRFYEQYRYGAAGYFNRYEAVYDKYYEVVRDYLVH